MTTTAVASLDTVQPGTRAGRTPVRSLPEAVLQVPLDRATVEGAFTLLDDAPVTVEAEAGLEIRVRAGCAWVPSCAEQCSVPVCEGECFTIRQDGRLTLLASRGTEIEFEWPASDRVRLH